MSQIFDCYIDAISSLKDKTLKIVLKTQEMKGEDMANIFKMNGELVKCLLSDANITREIINEIDNLVLVEDGKKSESEMTRNKLYGWWMTDPHGFDKFNDFYIDRQRHIRAQIDRAQRDAKIE